ncbi:MAG: integral membrane protein [Candidatus Azotimanducaceae bacterium]|jgi:integral membrane protein
MFLSLLLKKLLLRLPLASFSNKYNLRRYMFRFDSTMHRLRSIGFWEAISSILLFGVAMPLKYVWGNDVLIRPVGMVHGILWMGYVGLAFLAQIDYKWSWKLTGWLLVASIVPAGPFVADAKLLKDYEGNK